MKELFELATGSVLGRNHILAEKNNQDALHYFSLPALTIAIVCDGCGSSKHSEIGAKIGSRLITESISRHANDFNQSNKIALALESVRQDVLSQIRTLSIAMGDNFNQTIIDYFLFTAIGVIITPKLTTTFYLGDGLTIINGVLSTFGPFPNNEPPYLGYGLLNSSKVTLRSELIQFQINLLTTTADVQSILIGTDGLNDLIRVEQQKLPGTEELVGPISQFWENDKFFKNPDMVRRRLSVINRTFLKPDWTNLSLIKENGLLPDDTTLIIIRRKKLVSEV